MIAQRKIQIYSLTSSNRKKSSLTIAVTICVSKQIEIRIECVVKSVFSKTFSTLDFRLPNHTLIQIVATCIKGKWK